MPEPIQSSSVPYPNQSYYDPAHDISRVPEPSASPSTPAKTAPAQGPAASTSNPPGGRDVLLAKYGAGGQDCTTYLASAGTSLIVAGTSAAVGIVTAPSGIGALTGLAGTIGGIVNSAINIAGYLNCEEKNDQARDTAAECSSKGGALVPGEGDSDAVCITPRQ